MTTTVSDLHSTFEYLEIAAITCTGNSMVVKVLDVQGRIAKIIRQSVEDNIDRLRLNVEDLCTGKYIINIFSDDHFIKAVRYTKI